jgi:hypothetical protein
VGDSTNLPNGMELLGRNIAGSPLRDESFHFIYFFDRSAFKSLGVVEDKLGVAFEYELVFYVVISALNGGEKARR